MYRMRKMINKYYEQFVDKDNKNKGFNIKNLYYSMRKKGASSVSRFQKHK